MSLLCPIDFRYGRPQMKRIFEEEARLQRLLDVEAALARAESKVGLVPREAAAEITKKATTKLVTVKRVEELERETRHDLMAVVLALTEACAGDAGKYVHLGATSNDIQDSATALQLRDAIRVIEESLDGLIDAFADLATKHKKTIMLGRTHGQAAVPITFGLKVAVFASEVARQRERMRQATPRIVVGKMSGAVGTGAAFGPQALDNVRLWHERDPTNSAAERILIPHACVLIDEMLAKTTEIFRILRVFPDRMKANVEATKGQVMAEAVMMALAAKGLGRQEAHKLVRDAAQSARTKGTHLREALLAEARISKLLSKAEIDTAMDPMAYLGQSTAIVDSTLKRIR